MNSGTRSPAELWDALADFRRRVLSRMQPDLARLDGLDLTMAQSLALQQIAIGGPLTIAGLQARLSRAQATTSQLVSQLERRGLVERRADAADGRRTLVTLSRRGRRQMERLDEIRRRGFADVVEALPPRVQRQLIDALRATATALDAREAGEETP